MKKKYGVKKLLRMIVEWHETNNTGEGLEKWWDKYPTLSLKDVLKLARRKLNKKEKTI